MIRVVDLAAADRVVIEHRRRLAAVALLLAAAVSICWLVAKATGALAPAEGTPTPLRIDSIPWRFARSFSALADPATAIVTGFALAVFAVRTGSRRLACLVPAAAAVVVVTSMAKDLGPATTLPSGHAAYAASVLGLASWLTVRAGHPVAGTGLAALAVTVAPAVFLQGAHHAIDALGGFAAGLAWLIGLLVVAGPWALGSGAAQVEDGPPPPRR
jgi:hypothetical protein